MYMKFEHKFPILQANLLWNSLLKKKNHLQCSDPHKPHSKSVYLEETNSILKWDL
jgi:hypothetical protein